MSIDHPHASTEQLDSHSVSQVLAETARVSEKPSNRHKKQSVCAPLREEDETLDGEQSIFSVVESKRNSVAKPNMKSCQEPVISTQGRSEFQRRKSGSIDKAIRNSDLKHFGESLNPSTSDQNMAQVGKLVANAQTSMSGLGQQPPSALMKISKPVEKDRILKSRGNSKKRSKHQEAKPIKPIVFEPPAELRKIRELEKQKEKLIESHREKDRESKLRHTNRGKVEAQYRTQIENLFKATNEPAAHVSLPNKAPLISPTSLQDRITSQSDSKQEASRHSNHQSERQKIPLQITADQLFKQSFPKEIQDAFMIQTLKDPKLNLKSPTDGAGKRYPESQQQQRTLQLNLDNPQLKPVGSPTSIHGSHADGGVGSELRVRGESKIKCSRELDLQRHSFGMRSSNNQYTSEKGMGILQDADAVTEVMIDVLSSTLDPSEKFGGINQRMATLQGDETSPAGLGIAKRFSGNEVERPLKLNNHQKLTSSLEIDQNKAVDKKQENQTTKQLQTSRVNFHGNRNQTLCSLGHDTDAGPHAKRSLDMNLGGKQEDKEESFADSKQEVEKKMGGNAGQLKQVFVMGPAIVSTPDGMGERMKGSKKFNSLSLRTSIEKIKKGDKEGFKMLATRNFNDQVIINRKSFSDQNDSATVVNQFVQRARAKTHNNKHRDKNSSTLNKPGNKRTRLLVDAKSTARKSRQASQMKDTNVNLSTRGSCIVELSPIYLGDVSRPLLSPTLQPTSTSAHREENNGTLEQANNTHEQSKMTKQLSGRSDNFGQNPRSQERHSHSPNPSHADRSHVSFKDFRRVRQSLHDSSIGTSIDGTNVVKEIEMIAQACPTHQRMETRKANSLRRPVARPKLRSQQKEPETEGSKEVDLNAWSRSIQEYSPSKGGQSTLHDISMRQTPVEVKVRGSAQQQPATSTQPAITMTLSLAEKRQTQTADGNRNRTRTIDPDTAQDRGELYIEKNSFKEDPGKQEFISQVYNKLKKQADLKSRDHASAFNDDPILTLTNVQAMPYVRRGGKVDQMRSQERERRNLNLTNTQLPLNSSNAYSPVRFSPKEGEIRDSYNRQPSTALVSPSGNDSRNVFSNSQLASDKQTALSSRYDKPGTDKEDDMPKSPGSRAYIDLIRRRLEPNKTHFLETRLSKEGPKTSPSSAYGMRTRAVRNVIGEEEVEDDTVTAERVVSTNNTDRQSVEAGQQPQTRRPRTQGAQQVKGSQDRYRRSQNKAPQKQEEPPTTPDESKKVTFSPKQAKQLLNLENTGKTGPISVERTVKAHDKLHQANLSCRLVNKNQRLSWLDKKLNLKPGERKADGRMHSYAINQIKPVIFSYVEPAQFTMETMADARQAPRDTIMSNEDYEQMLRLKQEEKMKQRVRFNMAQKDRVVGNREYASLDSKRDCVAYPTPLERRIMNNMKQAEMTKNLNLFSERNALRAKAFSFKDPIRVTDLKHLDDLNTAKETTKATLREKAKFERRYTEEKQSMALRKSALEGQKARQRSLRQDV